MTIKLPKEQKQQLVQLVQQYFEKERDESLGNLEAEFLLDFFLSKAGPFIYNQAISEAQNYLRLRMTDVEDGFYELEQPLPRLR